MKLSHLLLGAVTAVTLGAASSTPYPLDGWEHTGIRRLRAYQRMAAGEIPGRIVFPPGAGLPLEAIHLRLDSVNERFDLGPDTPMDSALLAGVERIVGARHPSYRVAVVDITDPKTPRFAAVRGNEGYIPGSVGKLLVMTALFNELRRIAPDVERRLDLLRNTRIVADRFAMPNSHEVPIVNPDFGGVVHRAIRTGDEFTLWEWIDHMISPSSNAAGSMVWREAMLMRAFGRDYPVPIARVDSFFDNTPRADLQALSFLVMTQPLVNLGIDSTQLMQRTLFTAGGQRIVPGGGSYATPIGLVRWLIKLEQGLIVDEWSSLEMKRLLYFTRRRYRYASSPALDSAAVFFKSGSLYRCQAEEGYQCGQYRGNAENLMHSVAIVESPAEGPDQRVYLVSVMSNVLKTNSAGEHQEIGTRLERFLRQLHQPGEVTR